MQVLVKCEVCGKPLESAYCTTNVCRECCIKGKCLRDSTCPSRKMEKWWVSEPVDSEELQAWRREVKNGSRSDKK